MIKKTLLFSLLTLCSVSQAIQLGPNLLANSPSEYLLDIDAFIKDPQVTQLIGDELFQRNYLDEITTLNEVIGTAAERPTTPGDSYTFDDGQWIWIPDTLGSADGTWYWILRTQCYYESLFTNNLV